MSGRCEGCPFPAGCSRFEQVHPDGRSQCQTYLAAKGGMPLAKAPGPVIGSVNSKFGRDLRLVRSCPWRVPLPRDKQEGCGCKHWCALGSGDRPDRDDKTTDRHCLECVRTPGSPRNFAGV